MATTRLDSDERRKAIVNAAVPLFARKGFAGTTTRELAEAAGISEALLFRHFPSKQQLYREILALGCEGDPALERLATLPPSTATLATMVSFMVRRCALAEDVDRADIDERTRLVLHSWLEDGAYARELFDRIFERLHPAFAAAIEAAVAAGDIVGDKAASGIASNGITPSVSTGNRFWFSQHVAATIACSALPGSSCFAYHGTPEQLVDEATTFILRGIGLSEAAIARCRAELPGRMLAPAAD